MSDIEAPKPREWKFSGSSRTRPKERFGVFATGPFIREGDEVIVIERSAYLAEKGAREAAEARIDVDNALIARCDKLKAERQILVDALKVMASHEYEGHARSDAWLTIAREALKKVNE